MERGGLRLSRGGDETNPGEAVPCKDAEGRDDIVNMMLASLTVDASPTETGVERPLISLGVRSPI